MTAPLFEVVATGEARIDVVAEGVTVDILEVFPASEKVTGHELQVGDLLFDAHGGTHRIKRSCPVTKKGWKRTVREDGYVDYWAVDDVVTIIRPVRPLHEVLAEHVATVRAERASQEA